MKFNYKFDKSQYSSSDLAIPVMCKFLDEIWAQDEN